MANGIDNNKNNIRSEFSEAKCCGCGICAVICSTQAISIKLSSKGIYLPFVDINLCTHCSKCRQVCPGINLELNELNKSVFGNIPSNSGIGFYKTIYKGYSLNKNLRYQCSSGGLVTSVLLYLLSNGFISSALITKLKYGDSIVSEAYLARTESEIIASKGSKYCPVSLCSALCEIKHRKEKVAVVCLPCQAIALRKAIALDPILKENIFLILTLFCNQTPSFKALKHYLSRRKIYEKDVISFQWRGNGWPGVTKILTKKGEDCVPSPDAWSSCFGSGYFTPYACYCCYDFFGEFSDISFGDAWLPEQKNDKEGANVVIIRSLKAVKVLLEMQREGGIHLESLNEQKIANAFAHNIKVKKSGYLARQKLLKIYPKISQINFSPAFGFKNYLSEAKRLCKIKLGELFFQ